MIELKVKRLPHDDWSRPRLQNIETGTIYVDISCGEERDQPFEYNIPGDWHVATNDDWGEPIGRIRPDVSFIMASDNPKRKIVR